MEVFMMRFHEGRAVPLDLDQVLAGLQPFLEGPVREGAAKIAAGDGGADLHGITKDATSLIWSDITGRAAWDVLVRVADASGAAIVALGRPPCVTHAGMRSHLPEGLVDGAQVVTSGTELVQAIGGE